MGTNETDELKWSYFSAYGNKYLSVLYRLSESVDMRERERALMGVDLIQ